VNFAMAKLGLFTYCGENLIEGLMLHSSEFLWCILQRSFAHALISIEFSSGPGSTVPEMSNTWT